MNTSLAVVTEFYARQAAGDLASAAALLSPTVVLHVPGRHRLSGDYHGPEGVARFAARPAMRLQAAPSASSSST
jgi:uncharacterized protein